MDACLHAGSRKALRLPRYVISMIRQQQNHILILSDFPTVSAAGNDKN